MTETQLKEICEESYNRLKKACMELEKFLNHSSLPQLVEASP